MHQVNIQCQSPDPLKKCAVSLSLVVRSYESNRGTESDIEMACIFCIMIVLMQLKFVLLVVGILASPSMIFLARGGTDLVCSVAPL